MSSVTSCVLKLADPNIIHFLHKPFCLLAIKSSVTLISNDSPSVIQPFSQFNPPVDGSDFKIGPTLSWGLNKMTSRGPFQHNFVCDSMREVVIIATINMP